MTFSEARFEAVRCPACYAENEIGECLCADCAAPLRRQAKLSPSPPPETLYEAPHFDAAQKRPRPQRKCACGRSLVTGVWLCSFCALRFYR